MAEWQLRAAKMTQITSYRLLVMVKLRYLCGNLAVSCCAEPSPTAVGIWAAPQRAVPGQVSGLRKERTGLRGQRGRLASARASFSTD